MIPVKSGVVTTPYKETGLQWSMGWHTGVDIPAPKGTPIRAARNGVVVKAGSGVLGGALGIAVVIRAEDDGTFDRYCHLHSCTVAVDQKVTLTTKIGTVGSTGTNKAITGPHLHMERGTTPGWTTWQDPAPSLKWEPAPVPLMVVERWGARAGVKELVFRAGPGPNFPVATTKPRTWEGRMTHRTQDGKWVRTNAGNWIDKTLVERSPNE
jgi:murein DD-endopeptidase MepM/ murein hydrolase activator NlpD